MQKAVPVECEAGKKIYFKLRKPPYWKGWILHPSRPSIILSSISLDKNHILLSRNDLTQEEKDSFILYLNFRIDEILQWVQKSRVLLELEFMYGILCKLDIFDQGVMDELDNRIRGIYKSYYYSPNCGEELYVALRNGFTPSWENDIKPFNFHAESIDYLKQHFVDLAEKKAHTILDARATPDRDRKYAELREILEKVSFWGESQLILQQLCLSN